ncbi:thermonuclease family protein [Bacillus thuringiensis]|nr:thermonuclease family protein [Bacillus thuringiensis]
MKSNIFKLMLLSVLFLGGCSGVDSNQKHDATNIETTKNSDSVQSHEQNQLQTNTKESETKNKVRTIPATITKVTDGDTFKVKFDNGKKETIRLLCIDTPETVHRKKPVQPFGPEASSFTKKMLPIGKKVEVELGISERDKFGRLLAYVYVDGQMINKMLLEKGLARVAYVYAPNTTHIDEFNAIQKEAQKKGIGIWSIENYAANDFNTNSSTSSNYPKTNSTSSQSNSNDNKESDVGCKGKIKGNVNSKIYHAPDGEFYDKATSNIVWFCTEKEAKENGFVKSKR